MFRESSECAPINADSESSPYLVRWSLRCQSGMQLRDEIAQLFGRAVNVKHRQGSVPREEQRKTILRHFDVRITMRVRSGEVNTRQVDFDIRHVSPFRPFDARRDERCSRVSHGCRHGGKFTEFRPQCTVPD